MGNTMTGMLFILAGLTVHQFEAMLVKRYGKKHGAGGMFFNAIICLFAMIYFFITDKGGLQFSTGVIIYGLINRLMYAIGFYAAYLAYRCGSFGLTRLLTSFASIIPIFFGILVLKEPTTLLTYISLILIFLSLFLMNYQGKTQEGSQDQQKFSFKWIIFVILIILSNALISIISKLKVDNLGTELNNEYLIICYAGASLGLFILGFIFERDNFKSTIKYGFTYGAAAGIFNGINNLLILITYEYLPISFISPVRTGLGMVIAFLLSIFLYKEKFTLRQLVSAGIGIVAVILMNLKF